MANNLGRSPGESPQAIKTRLDGRVLEFGSATRTRTWDPMINSHLLYRLSYRGITVRILLIRKGKSSISDFPLAVQRTWAMAWVTAGRLRWFSAATQMRPVPTA